MKLCKACVNEQKNEIMDKYNVYLSEPAQEDMDEILNYISTQLSAPITAENMIDTFHKAMSGLEIMPKRQPSVGDAFLASLGYRILPVKNYLVFCSVHEPTTSVREVNIERVLYAGRDWQNLLNPKESE